MRIIASAYRYLVPGGTLALEMGWDQAKAVTAIASAAGRYNPIKILKDYSGNDRIAVRS
jgi:release factor glutamine methyltransferase